MIGEAVDQIDVDAIKAEIAGGIRQERETGIADRCGELHRACAQGSHVA